jgi:hypothetical protein
MKMKRLWSGCLLLFVLVPAPPAAALSLLGGLLGTGGSISLPISLSGLLGSLTVAFENVTGLSLLDLGVSIILVSPTDPALLARLPAGVTIPSTLPILVHINPAAAGGLSFKGLAKVQIYSLSLLGSPASTRRLYAAPDDGGSFVDITNEPQSASLIDLGTSYRVSGSRGGFSEFLIVNDATALSTAVGAKLDLLDGLLADYGTEIAAPVRATLLAQLATVRTDVGLGNTAAAILDLNTFLSTVVAHSGADIPDVWRAARDLDDVAGLLRAEGNTLLFSLQAM